MTVGLIKCLTACIISLLLRLLLSCSNVKVLKMTQIQKLPRVNSTIQRNHHIYVLHEIMTDTFPSATTTTTTTTVQNVNCRIQKFFSCFSDVTNLTVWQTDVSRENIRSRLQYVEPWAEKKQEKSYCKLLITRLQYVEPELKKAGEIILQTFNQLKDNLKTFNPKQVIKENWMKKIYHLISIYSMQLILGSFFFTFGATISDTSVKNITNVYRNERLIMFAISSSFYSLCRLIPRK